MPSAAIIRVLHVHVANADAPVGFTRFQQINQELEIAFRAGAEKPAIVNRKEPLAAVSHEDC